MRRDPQPFLRQAILLALVLSFASCTDDNSLMQPTTQGLYTTPTGLVTANPPEILVGAGDIASCGNNNDEATAKIVDTIPGTVMVLGDNVYENGTTSEFNNCYHPTWGRHKARTKPATGNHEYNTSGAAPYYAYFGAAAGVAGQGYYSYDLGAWHIIVINSSISRSSGSAQDNWLVADLAAHQNLCTLAYFHHPLYSSTGGSGSGGTTYSSSRRPWDVMYAAGADLVLGGHRHFYERLAPMKPDGSADNTYGIRELIAGTGGIGGGTMTNVHPRSEVRNGSTRGVLKLYLYDDSYAWKFIPIAGQTFTDSGSTACHGAPGSGPAISPSLSTVTASPATLTAGGGASTITVTVKNTSGNPVSNVTVVLSATGTGNTLVQPSGKTNSSGVATGSLSSTVAQAKTVSATANGISITQTAVVAVNPGPVSASQSTVAASPTSIVAGSGSSTITVTAKDASGNQISGATVVLAATGTGNTLTQPSGPTNGSGVATGTLSSTVAQTKTVSATANGVAITQTATVTVTSGSGGVSPSLSTVAASPTSITAGSGTSTITVTVKDGGGAPMSGVTVNLSATGSGNSITQPASATDVNGVATGSLGSTGAGSKTVTAVAGGVTLNQQPVVTVTAGSPDAGQSTVAAAPTSITAGSGSSTITVTVKDQFGNPVSGSNVVLAATGTGNTLTGGGATNGSGVATGSLSSTVAEPKTISATANGTGIIQTASVTVTPAGGSGTITHTLLTAGNNQASLTVYTTGSITPAPNTLVTIAVLGHRVCCAARPSPTVSGGGMSAWTEVATIDFDTLSTLTHKRLTVFRAMSATPGSGPITITWSATESNSQWIVSQWDGVETTGENGAGAIGQTGTNRADAVNGLTVPLGAFASSSNVGYGVFAVSSQTPAITPGAGFTEISEQASAESPLASLMAEWKPTNTINATWTNLNGGALGIELKAKLGP